jgi:hypothetical protein
MYIGQRSVVALLRIYIDMPGADGCWSFIAIAVIYFHGSAPLYGQSRTALCSTVPYGAAKCPNLSRRHRIFFIALWHRVLSSSVGARSQHRTA